MIVQSRMFEKFREVLSAARSRLAIAQEVQDVRVWLPVTVDPDAATERAESLEAPSSHEEGWSQTVKVVRVNTPKLKVRQEEDYTPFGLILPITSDNLPPIATYQIDAPGSLMPYLASLRFHESQQQLPAEIRLSPQNYADYEDRAGQIKEHLHTMKDVRVAAMDMEENEVRCLGRVPEQQEEQESDA